MRFRARHEVVPVVRDCDREERLPHERLDRLGEVGLRAAQRRGARAGMTAGSQHDEATRITGALDAASRQGFAAWSAALTDELADEVEIRHAPPVAGLDGWRDRDGTAAYLRAEVGAFPRAFEDDFVTEVETSVVGAETLVAAVTYAGTLRLPDGPYVRIGFRLEIGLRDGRVARLDAGYLPDTDRADLVRWLKAVEAAGGFRPPPPARP